MSTIARSSLAILVIALAGCGSVQPSVTLPGTTPSTGNTPAQQQVASGWQVFNSEHIALWYHALALTRAGIGATTPTVPIYKPGYVEEIASARRRLNAQSTLATRANEFAQAFNADAAYTALQFLPLYFESAEALYTGVDLWNRAQGDPRNASSQQAAAVIQLLSSQFPRESQRNTVVDFVRAAQDEQRAFFHTYWQEQLARLDRQAASLRGELRSMSTLQRFLEYAQLGSADVFLVPALNGEGRTTTSGTQRPRLAIGAGDDADQVLFNALHEVMYTVAGDVVKDNVSPAEIRNVGEDVLVSRAAVRGGALLLQRLAPGRVAAYRGYYLRSAGRTGTTVEAFNQAYPISSGVETGLQKEIQTGFSGF